MGLTRSRGPRAPLPGTAASPGETKRLKQLTRRHGLVAGRGEHLRDLRRARGADGDDVQHKSACGKWEMELIKSVARRTIEFDDR